MTFKSSHSGLQVNEELISRKTAMVPGNVAVFDTDGKMIDSGIASNVNLPFANGSYALGTSILYGFGLSTPPTNSFFYYTAKELGLASFFNIAASGTGARKAAGLFAANKPDGQSLPIITDGYFNNVRVNANPQVRYDSAVAGTKALAAINWTKDTYFIFTGTVANTLNPNAAFSSASGWGSAAGAGAGSLADFGSRAVWYRANVPALSACSLAKKSAVVANETLTFSNLNGTGITVLTYGTDGVTNNYSRIQYAVDGVIMGVYDPNGKSYLGFPDGGTTDGLMNDAIVINGLTPGVHTLVLTFLDAGKPTAIDYIGTLVPPTISQAAPVYIMDAYHMSATGYATAGFVTTEAIMDGASAYVRTSLSTTFQNYAFGFVNTNSIYDPSDPTQVQADGVHPSLIGQRNLYLALMPMFKGGFVNLSTTMGVVPFVSGANQLKDSIISVGTDFVRATKQNGQFIITDGTRNAGYFSIFDDYIFYGVNRNPSTGTVFNPAKCAAVYAILGGDSEGSHEWYVSATPGAAPVSKMKLNKDGTFYVQELCKTNAFFNSKDVSFWGTFNDSANMGANRNPITGNVTDGTKHTTQYAQTADTTGAKHEWFGSTAPGAAPTLWAYLNKSGKFANKNDIIVDDATKGYLIKAPNGNYWRLTIDNSGNIVTTNTGTTF